MDPWQQAANTPITCSNVKTGQLTKKCVFNIARVRVHSWSFSSLNPMGWKTARIFVCSLLPMLSHFSIIFFASGRSKSLSFTEHYEERKTCNEFEKAISEKKFSLQSNVFFSEGGGRVGDACELSRRF
jgi:hypothetical protein